MVGQPCPPEHVESNWKRSRKYHTSAAEIRRAVVGRNPNGDSFFIIAKYSNVVKFEEAVRSFYVSLMACLDMGKASPSHPKLCIFQNPRAWSIDLGDREGCAKSPGTKSNAII